MKTEKSTERNGNENEEEEVDEMKSCVWTFHYYCNFYSSSKIVEKVEHLIEVSPNGC